nr:MAG TPA: hypothetical protein [Ackermannviridae sp.]DAW82277.1 MAG TPA: hypothetical protein [Bacteriophage sp.]
MQEVTLELLKQIVERELPKDKTKELNFYLDLTKWTYKGVHLKDVRVVKAPYEIRFELRVAYKDKITPIQVYESKDFVYKLDEFATKEILDNKSILSGILYDILGNQHKSNTILSIYKNYLTLSNKLIKITQVYYYLNSVRKSINITLLYEYNNTKYYMELYDIFRLEKDIDKEVERLGV